MGVGLGLGVGGGGWRGEACALRVLYQVTIGARGWRGEREGGGREGRTWEMGMTRDVCVWYNRQYSMERVLAWLCCCRCLRLTPHVDPINRRTGGTALQGRGA